MLEQLHMREIGTDRTREIGTKLRHLRMEGHYNQKEFAHLVGWKPGYLSRFEKGRWGQIELEKLDAVVSLLGISYDTLLSPSRKEAV